MLHNIVLSLLQQLGFGCHTPARPNVLFRFTGRNILDIFLMNHEIKPSSKLHIFLHALCYSGGMAHKTFMTTEDRIQTAVRPSRTLVAAGWTAVTAGFALAAVAATSGVAALGLGIVTAFTAFKAYDNIVAAVKGSPKPMHSHSTKEDLRTLDGNSPARSLANNLEPVPQLADDLSAKEWQKQITDRARQDAINHANNISR